MLFLKLFAFPLSFYTLSISIVAATISIVLFSSPNMFLPSTSGTRTLLYVLYSTFYSGYIIYFFFYATSYICTIGSQYISLLVK